MAMTEQVTGRPIPDVVLSKHAPKDETGGIAVASAPPTARLIKKFERIKLRQEGPTGLSFGTAKRTIVAIIEIVSPGNKDSRNTNPDIRREGRRHPGPRGESGRR